MSRGEVLSGRYNAAQDLIVRNLDKRAAAAAFVDHPPGADL